MKPLFARALAGTFMLATCFGITGFASSPAGAAVSTTTASYTGPAVFIPDSPGPAATATVPVAGMQGDITDVDFSFDGSACSSDAGSTTVGLEHTFVADLQVRLISPDGTDVTLINFVDGGGNNFCQTVLDDDAGAPSIGTVVSAQAPFTGTFAPSNPLSAFDGGTPNGDWTLSVQDFAGIDVGNIRAFSVIVETTTTNAITATKTVAGDFVEGGSVAYTVALTNNGNVASTDNPGNEFVDVLSSNLTLVSATATAGTAVATVGTNTVTWNGSIGAGATVTITINATIDAATGGTVISNQGQTNTDPDVDGTNDLAGLTDDPTAAGAADVTSFPVAAQATTTAPSSTTTAAVTSATLPETGGRASAGQAGIGLGVFLVGVGFVILSSGSRRRVTSTTR